MVEILQKFEHRFRWLAQRGKFTVVVEGDDIVVVTSEFYEV